VIELLLQAEGALSVGSLDRAEALYRQVASADPRNAIAIVGLSRVALERGRQHEALVLARQALEIDRENVAAQRMVKRLEEVLAFRGEAVPGGTVDQVGHPVPEGATERALPGRVGHPVPEGATERALPGRVGHPVPEPHPSVLEPFETEPTPPELTPAPPEPQPPPRRSLLDRLRGRR
jgi:tetratricopeptide (TPR) repeat protein